MVNPFSILRAIAWLKRLALATESLASSSADLLALERERFNRQYPPLRLARHADFHVASVDDMNATWRDSHPQYVLDEEGEEGAGL